MAAAPDEPIAAADTALDAPGEASPTLPPPPPPVSTGRLVLLAGLMGALASATFVAGSFAREAFGRRISIVAVAVTLLLVLKLGLDRVARWAAPSQGVVVTSLAAASLAPFFTAGALSATADPLVMSSWRCGTAEMALLFFAPIGLFLFGALATLVTAGFLGGGRGELFRPLIRIVAILTTILAGWLVLLGLVRSARQPDIDRYIDSLPVVATLAPLAEPPVAGPMSPLPKEADDDKPVAAHRDSVGDFDVYRACKNHRCGVAVSDADIVRAALSPADTMGREVAESAPLTVRSDEDHSFVVIEGPSRRAYKRPYRLAAESMPPGGVPLWPATDILVRDVADAASPPLGWLLGGLGGLLAACGLLLANFRRSRRLRALLAGTPGILGESGWISFDGDRPPARLDPSADLAPGPVLVADDGAGHGGAYRGDGLVSAARVVSGTRKAWSERHEAAAAELHAWAIATAGLGAAPLVAAALVGFVW